MRFAKPGPTGLEIHYKLEGALLLIPLYLIMNPPNPCHRSPILVTLVNVVLQSVQQPVAHSGGNVQHANLQLTRSNLTTTSHLKKNSGL